MTPAPDPYAGPKSLGARCDQCPLRTDGKGPCASEILPGTSVLAVGQEPGASELQANRPLAGRSGRLFDKALPHADWYRPLVSTTNVVACQPPGGDIRAYESKLRTKNAKRVHQDLPPVPLPTECCHPRLLAEAAPFRDVIALGAVAGAALYPRGQFKGGIGANRGRIFQYPVGMAPDPTDPAVTPGRRILATYNPAHVLREPEEYEVMVADLRRARRWFSQPDDSGLLWRPPRFVYRPDPAFLDAVLLGRDVDGYRPFRFAGVDWHTLDFETDSIFAMTANVRCLGIGTDEWAMIVPFEPVSWGRSRKGLSKEASKRRKLIEAEGTTTSEAVAQARSIVQRMIGPQHFPRSFVMDNGATLAMYEPDELDAILHTLARWAVDPGVHKTGWNSGSYDRLKWEHWPAIQAVHAKLGHRAVVHGSVQALPHPVPHTDGILVKRNARSHLQNDLGFNGSYWTDIHNWKGDHAATDAKSDEHLWHYNGLDDVVTTRILPPLIDVASQEGATVPFVRSVDGRMLSRLDLDHRTQAACVELARNGMYVDQVERQRLHLHLAAPGRCVVADKKGKPTEIPMGSIHRWALKVRQILQASDVDVKDIVSRSKKADRRNQEWRDALDDDGLRLDTGTDDPRAQDPDGDQDGMVLPSAKDLTLDTMAFNPLSHPQLRAVLFEEWQLPTPTDMKEKELYTSSGEISTGDAVLRRLFTDTRLTEYQREFIRAVRMTRRYAKLWGTFVHPFRLPTGDEHLDRGCRVWGDGRVHASWSPHTAITGRLAAQGPNLMNIPLLIRAMMVGQPVAPTGRYSGRRVLVGFDMDQLEFRVAASRWGAKGFIEAFQNRLDAYQVTMRAVFGDERMARYQGGPPVFGSKKFESGGQFYRQRKLAKQLHLATQYAAGMAIRERRPQVVDLATIMRLVTSAEDKDTGELEFAALSMGEIEHMHTNWLRGCSEYVDGWQREWDTVRAHGYNAESITGRRRPFGSDAGPPSLNAVVNFPIQAAAAGLLNLILDNLVAEIPFGAWGPGTGVINQCHDAITVECPEEEAEAVYAIMERLMTVTHPSLPGVVFTTEGKTAWPAKDPRGLGLSRWSET